MRRGTLYLLPSLPTCNLCHHSIRCLRMQTESRSCRAPLKCHADAWSIFSRSHFTPDHRSLTPLTTSLAVNECMFANVFVAAGHPLRRAEDSSDGSNRSGGQRSWLKVRRFWGRGQSASGWSWVLLPVLVFSVRKVVRGVSSYQSFCWSLAFSNHAVVSAGTVGCVSKPSKTCFHVP